MELEWQGIAYWGMAWKRRQRREASWLKKKKGNKRISSTITKKEIRKLTLTGQLLDVRHYARCLILFPFYK